MGAWGYSALECDEGLEIKDQWDAWKKSGYDDSQVFEFFLERWGDALRHGDTVTNNEVIALAALSGEEGIPLPAKIRKIAISALNWELEPVELERWNNTQERKEYLDAFLTKLGGQRKRPKAPRFFLDPALSYRSSEIAKKKLIKAFRKIERRKLPMTYKDAGFPEFVSTLERLMSYGTCEKDSNFYLEATNQRLMMLSAYLAINTGMSESELEALLDRVVEH